MFAVEMILHLVLFNDTTSFVAVVHPGKYTIYSEDGNCPASSHSRNACESALQIVIRIKDTVLLTGQDDANARQTGGEIDGVALYEGNTH